MARTYLERNLDKFERCGREDLVKHGLKALRESLAQDKELTVENTSIGIIGMGAEGKRRVEGFKLYDGPEVGALLEANQESPPEQWRQGAVSPVESRWRLIRDYVLLFSDSLLMRYRASKRTLSKQERHVLNGSLYAANVSHHAWRTISVSSPAYTSLQQPCIP
jgi:hypothetical protein